MSNYDKIPEELKLLKQWVCFDILPPLKRGGKPRKMPYTPGTLNQAASNRPTEWRSFEEAVADVTEGSREHIGFVFNSTDPYVFIDLDDPEDKDQKRVLKRLDTYAQTSISGEGVHVICKGTFKGKGKHPASPMAGIFKENRFCLFTGDIVDGRSTIKKIPTGDLQAIHTWLKGGKDDDDVELEEHRSLIPDMTVFEMGCERFHKFESLCRGDWQKYDEFNNDHSTADHGFLAMLCDLTPSNDQVRYLFSISGMWSEERAEKKSGHGFDGYVDRTLKKIRAKQAREDRLYKSIKLDFTITEEVLPEKPKSDKKFGDRSLIDTLPEGLVRDLAEYSFRASFHPLQEASVLQAFTIVSGLAGRKYMTPTKMGLNMWMVLVGGTSCGKDEFQSGMERVFNHVGKRVPSIRRLLGGEFVSGPAIETVFADRKRYISYMPEFGDMFKSLANPMAPDHIRTLSRGLLNSFNAAGANGSIRARKRAGASEGEDFVERPCLVLAGEATPESLYGAMTSRELATGFLQRFVILNVPLTSWSEDENYGSSTAPPKQLLARLEALALAADTADVPGSAHKGRAVGGDPEALVLLKKYRLAKRKETMTCPEGLAQKEVFNRAGLKVLKVASLLAVSANEHAPHITMEHARWAIDFIEQTDNDLLERFSSGEMGAGQVKQETEILRAATVIQEMSISSRRKMGMVPKVARDNDLIPSACLKALVVNSAVFSSDRLGAVTAYEKSVESLVRSGKLSKIPKDYASDNFDHLHGELLCVN